jgi:hypothetical protein
VTTMVSTRAQDYKNAGEASGGFLNRRDHCLAAKVSAAQA